MSAAFVFPGQGSQSVGMLSELAIHYPQVEGTFAEASDCLGYDLWKLVSNGPADSLNQTDKTQPAMLAAGIATWRCYLSKCDVKPDFIAGHSLGEYTALVAAEALAFSDAIKLVELRGQLMQQAVPEGEGAMAAIIGLDDMVVKEICHQAAEDKVAEAVNFNSPGQVVIAGNTQAIERAMKLAKERGARRALPLPVSVPSHCQLMKPAADKLSAALADVEVRTPSIPVIHNVSVTTAKDSNDIKLLLAQQLYQPVRWVETVQWLVGHNVKNCVECGPGKVLSGLMKRIDKTLTLLPVYDPATLDAAVEKLGEK